MKKQFIKLFVLIFIVLCINPKYSFSGNKIKVKDIGLIKIIPENGMASEQHEWGTVGLAFTSKNYMVNTENMLSLGFYTGSGFNLIPPAEFNFTPQEGMFVSPQIGIDIDGGLAVSTNLNDEIRLVSHLGAVVNTAFNILVWSDANTHFETASIGILPELGTRLFLNDNLNIGLSFRFGKLKNYAFQDFKKAGDPVSSKYKAVILGIAIRTTFSN